MAFTETQIQSLLAQKGMGPTVLKRLQQMGLDDVTQLAAANVEDILQQGAVLTGSACWKNSPQAKSAVRAAVEWAKQQSKTGG